MRFHSPVWPIARKFILALTIAAAVPHLLSCASSTTDWEKAQYRNTISAYNSFIEKHPESEFAGEARKRSDRISFEAAKRNNSVPSLKRYIGDYPHGLYQEEATYLLAQKQSSIEDYEAYLTKYPQGQFEVEAVKSLDELYFRNAEQSRSSKAYQAYLARFPSGLHRESALRAVQYLPLVEACLAQDKQVVARLMDSGQSLAQYAEAASLLLEIMRLQAKKSMRVTQWSRTFNQSRSGFSVEPSMKSIQLNMEGSIATLVNGSGDVVFHDFVGISKMKMDRFLAQFALLLEAGADPNAMRILDFNPASSNPVPDGAKVTASAQSTHDGVLIRTMSDIPHAKGIMLHSTGSPGTIVPNGQEGLSALGMAEAAKLTDNKALLLKYGARP